MEELNQPWGEDYERKTFVQIVDDPSWSNATVEDVRAAVQAADRTVFNVDSTGIQHSHFSVLAIDLDCTEGTTQGESTFRLESAAVPEVRMQRFMGNLSFADFVDQAERDSEGVKSVSGNGLVRAG